MRFYPRGAAYFAGFLAAVALASQAREGNAGAALAIVGLIAAAIVDVLLTFWPLFATPRVRRGHD